VAIEMKGILKMNMLQLIHQKYKFGDQKEIKPT
jgi:hypothetical protein